MTDAALRRRSLRDRMKWEIVERSTPGGIPFVFFGLMVVIYPFGTEQWSLLIRICGFVTFLVCSLRIPFVQRVMRSGRVTNGQYRFVQSLILVNAVSWSLVFALTTLDFIERGSFSPFSFCLFMGFSTGALYSLAASRLCFNFYIMMMLGLQVLVYALAVYVFHYQDDSSVLIMLAGMLLYILREGANLRGRMVRSHRDQIRSEITNRLLVRSRQELVEQTSRNVHSSRLASLGEMAGGVAHEINNPLAIIDLNLESLRIQLDEDGEVPADAARKTIQRCQASVSRITKIVRGLRNFSRAGDQDPVIAVPLSQIVDDTLDFCREKIKAQQIQFELSGDTSMQVLCRPVEISQILVNLVNNSYDVVSDLPAADRYIHFTIAKNATHAVIRVTDSGPPLPQSVKDKFFQPFFTTKPVGVGTGLGLSISRAIAKRHGGDLTLDTSARNTTFLLQVPLLLQNNPTGSTQASLEK